MTAQVYGIGNLSMESDLYTYAVSKLLVKQHTQQLDENQVDISMEHCPTRKLTIVHLYHGRC